MVTTFYAICLIISVLVLIRMSSRNYGNIDSHFWTIIILIPIIILGFWLKTQVNTPEGAMVSFCFIYLDSTVLYSIMVFLMLSTIGIRPQRWFKLLVYTAAFAHLALVWSNAFTQLYYRRIELDKAETGTITHVIGGPLILFHYIYLILIFSLLAGIVVIGLFRQGTFSRRSFFTYSLIVGAALVLYGLELILDLKYSLLPFLYIVGDVIIALRYEHIHSHELSSIFAQKLTQRNANKMEKPESQRGYAAFDIHLRYLCRNERILDFWPELETQRVDEMISSSSRLRNVFYSMIIAFQKRGESSYTFRLEDKTVVCEISTFSFNRPDKPRGYFFEVRDTTREQALMDQVAENNVSLEQMVTEKTGNILAMQGKLVSGMANLIENRDNNTGGHVKRTSDIIRIIIDEIRSRNHPDIDEKLANDIVRAAPMHDLGKISIENSILNKPARLTPEEYEIMKTHASKSSEIVMILLKGVEEEHFVNVAYHVARYHHERWDGKGYPEKLSGTMIPIEARIMAVADVYDALSSKRCYKEAMQPDQAARIMLEGMGTQFDPSMKPVFLACREKLEAYYRTVNENTE